MQSMPSALCSLVLGIPGAWGFRKYGVPLLGVPIIRSLVF